MLLRALTVLAFLVLTGVSDAGGAEAQETTTVLVGDFFFCEKQLGAGACETVVELGEGVTWDYAEGTAGHTVTYCGDSCDDPVGSPLFDSGKLLAGETFTSVFNEPGRYLYYCEFHPVAMRASVVVQPPPTSTSGPAAATDELSPVPSAGDAITPGLTTASTSPTGSSEAAESDADGSLVWPIAAIVAVAALAVVGTSLIAFRRWRT